MSRGSRKDEESTGTCMYTNLMGRATHQAPNIPVSEHLPAGQVEGEGPSRVMLTLCNVGGPCGSAVSSGLVEDGKLGLGILN